MAGERQVWEDKYKMDMGKQSQEIVELKIELRAEKIGQLSCEQKTSQSRMPFAQWNNP